MEDWQTEKSIIESNEFLINNETLSDISFSFPKENKESEIIYSHKLMLSKRSAVFFAMFNGSFAKPKQVVIEDASKEAFLIFLSYVYTDVAQITPENVSELYYLGNKYLVKGLQNECVIYVEKNISLDNVLCIANSSIKFVCDDLLNQCSQFIGENNGELIVLEKFLNIEELDLMKYILNMDKSSCDEITLFRGVLKWAKEYCENNEKEMKELSEIFQLIRFPTMSLTEFSECANYTDIFSSMAEIGEIFCYITSKNADKYDKLPFKKNKREMPLINVSLDILNFNKGICKSCGGRSDYYLDRKIGCPYPTKIQILFLEDCFLTGVKILNNDCCNFKILKGNELIGDITKNHFQIEYFLLKDTEYTFTTLSTNFHFNSASSGSSVKYNGRTIFKICSGSSNFIAALELKVRC